MKIDVLIVGQGLAGSFLAWECLEKGISVVVVDDKHQTSASALAAGMINPITGQRLTLENRFREFQRKARASLSSIERFLGRPLYFERAIVRYFQGRKERELWERRRLEDRYRGYLPMSDSSHYFRILGGAYCDCKTLLEGVGRRLSEEGCLIREAFDHGALQFMQGTAHKVAWKKYRARWVIFCEGYRWDKNPWWNWIPSRPARGEIVTLRSISGKQTQNIHQMSGKWLLPLADGLFKAGSTYDWDEVERGPTPEGRLEIVSALAPLLERYDLDGVDQVAGVRPVSLDRQPLLGFHREEGSIGIFNGFGAKGVLRIPHYAALFVNFLRGKQSLPREADTCRFANRGY